MTQDDLNKIKLSLLVDSVLASTEGTYYYNVYTSSWVDKRYTAVQVHSGTSGLSFGQMQQDIANGDPGIEARFNGFVDAAVARV